MGLRATWAKPASPQGAFRRQGGGRETHSRASPSGPGLAEASAPRWREQWFSESTKASPAAVMGVRAKKTQSGEVEGLGNPVRDQYA